MILGSALNVVLYIVFGAMAVGFAGVVLCWIGLMIFGAVTWPVFKVRRWYRVIEDAGDNYDFDGLRVHRDADFDPYYVRKYNVLLPLPHLGRGFLTNDATWCAAYNGRSEEIWITRRTREPRRLPRRLRNIEDLEELRPKLRELDRLAFPWRYSEDDDYERAGVGE